jgi:prepilin-type N-terminal cleavage/methylation domain-containing protein
MMLRGKNGFTLIEIIFAIAILGTILSVITTVYIISLKNNQISSTKSGYQKDLNFTIDDLNKNVKQAKAVICRSLPVALGCTTYCTLNNTTLLLSIPAIDSAGSFKYTNGGQTLVTDTFVYYLSGNTLHKKTYADPSSFRYPQNNSDKIIAKDVTALTFTYLPAQSAAEQVQTTITMSRMVQDTNVRVSGTMLAFMRNK